MHLKTAKLFRESKAILNNQNHSLVNLFLTLFQKKIKVKLGIKI